MQGGWLGRVRLILTLFVVLTTFPLATVAQEGTPEVAEAEIITTEFEETESSGVTIPNTVDEDAGDSNGAEESDAVEGAAPAIDTEASGEPAPTDDAGSSEEPEPAEDGLVTVEKGTDSGEPAPAGDTGSTGGDTGSTGGDTAGDTSSVPAVKPATGPSTDTDNMQSGSQEVLQAQATAMLAVEVGVCGNDDRIGEFDFLILGQMRAMAGDTSYGCDDIDASVTVTATLTPDGGGDAIAGAWDADGSYVGFVGVPAGAYTLTLTVGGHTGTSGRIELSAGILTLMQAIVYVVEESQPDPGTGIGSISVQQIVCEDAGLAGTTVFLASAMMRMATTPCTLDVPQGATSFTVQRVGDPEMAIGPKEIDRSGEARFTELTSGSWTVTQHPTGSTSEPITIVAGASIDVLAITYVEQLVISVDLEVQKVFCETDDDRVGTTQFVLDSGPGFGILATSSTCYAEAPNGEQPAVKVTLVNQETEESVDVELNEGRAYVEDLPGGTYTATETVDGVSITSDPFELRETGKRLRIINYVAGGGLPEPEEGGYGDLQGTLFFCSAPGRDGDVEFIVGSSGRDEVIITIAAVTECVVGTAISGQLVVYPVDPDTGEANLGAGEVAWTWGGSFYVDDLQAGYYRLGYLHPLSTTAVLSDPFVVDHRADAVIDVNVFSAPVYTSEIEIWKDVCVDRDRVGEVDFQINEPFTEGDLKPLALAAMATECRFSTEADGTFEFALTSVDTGRTWTRTVVGGDWLTFEGIPTGTYTLTETRGGAAVTSAPFSVEAAAGTYSIYVRNFIAERDWAYPVDGDEGEARVIIWGYVCTDQERNGGAQYFYFGPQGDEMLTAAASISAQAIGGASTAECREATANDAFAFTAVPLDPDAEPVPFVYDGWGSYVPETEAIPAGDYVITEEVTGASTGTLRFFGGYWHDIDFLAYAEQDGQVATVTLDVASADPDVVNLLPNDATWTVSQDGTDVVSGAFGENQRALPTSVELPDPLPYGTYTVTINAGPAFLPYSQSVTVDAATVVVDVVLQPVTPEEPQETNDVVVTVTTVDGGAIPNGTQVCLSGSDYDECLVLDVVAGQMLALAVPSGATVTFNDVPVGAYELTVPANAPYQAHAQTLEISSGDPVTTAIILQLQDAAPTPTPVDPEPTPGDSTPAPNAPTDPGTATPTPGRDVTGLPSTGGGSATDGASGLAVLLLAGALSSAALGLAMRGQQRRSAHRAR